MTAEIESPPAPGITEPTVTLLAHTTLTPAAWDLVDFEGGVTASDALAEDAGRGCYESWHKPNPATATNATYLAHVIGQGHESVLSHASATFQIGGVSRSLTHELVRHRWLSFSERSLRFVDASDMRPVYPPAADDGERQRIDRMFTLAIDNYRVAVEFHQKQGLTRKQAREAARALLPLCTETRIVVSANHRGWRDMLKQRLAPGADAEINRLAFILLDQLTYLAPNTYADIPLHAVPQRVVAGVQS